MPRAAIKSSRERLRSFSGLSREARFLVFFIFRMVLFFGVWYWFLVQIRKNMLAEDLDNSTKYWHNNQVLSTVF
jgi:hypothetical protein